MTMTFETLQKNLQIVLDKANIKAGTKKGMLVEYVYLVAMCDNNVHIPSALIYAGSYSSCSCIC